MKTLFLLLAFLFMLTARPCTAQVATDYSAVPYPELLRFHTWCVSNSNGGIWTTASNAMVKMSADQVRVAYAAAHEELNKRIVANGGMVFDPAMFQKAPRAPRRQEAAQPRAAAAAPQVYTGFIDGEFNGFEHEKVFKLMDGTVWQQTSLLYHYFYAYNPQVTIHATSAGWKLSVQGSDQAVTVERLK